METVAQRFITEHPGAPRTIPPGADGLARLADAIDAWAEREDVDDAHDESFVEGAGALLALLLLHHFPSGVHTARDGAHRIRVGEDGFFDPFAAVESALEGPSARDVLVSEVAVAEAEARGHAGVGRLVRLLRQSLREVRHDLGVREHFAQHVVLSDGTELDLSRVLATTAGEDDATARAAIDKLVTMLPGGAAAAGLAWDEARMVLLPRLVPPGFFEDLRSTLACRTLLGGALSCAFILGYEGRARYVRSDELARWNVDPEAALATALENLALRSDRARFVRVDTPEGPMCVARTGDGLDGARLLLPTLHSVLAPELGSPILAAAPHRDALLLCAAEPPALRAALARRVQHEHARAPHRIGDAIFVVAATGLRTA